MGSFSGQYIAQPHPIGQIENLVNDRLMQVSIHQQNAFTGLSDQTRQISRYGSVVGIGTGIGDQDGFDRL